MQSLDFTGGFNEFVKKVPFPSNFSNLQYLQQHFRFQGNIELKNVREHTCKCSEFRSIKSIQGYFIFF